MAWKVLVSGTMLDIATGGKVAGRPVSTSRICAAGEEIPYDLTAGMVQRYREEEPFLRERIQYGEIVTRDPDDEHEEPWKEFVPKDLPDADEPTGSEGESEGRGGDKESAKALEVAKGELEKVKKELAEVIKEKDEAEVVAAGALSYSDLSTEALTAEAEAQKLVVTGTGKDGNVLKKDYVAALEGARSAD